MEPRPWTMMAHTPSPASRGAASSTAGDGSGRTSQAGAVPFSTGILTSSVS
ncbi:hypothetical protein ACFFX0_05650 [Citricoccus parietis]|uniref:Uncharacterized protein n=1 Tax=Citricoccus parietis TaxID=592307 RepID=A0ABV5FVI5_9MICC